MAGYKLLRFMDVISTITRTRRNHKMKTKPPSLLVEESTGTRWSLHPKTCTFGVASEKFLRYLVTRRGIEADPDEISAILNMKSLTCMKEVQMLNERLTVLNRFISRSTDKCMPFFQALKKMESTSAGVKNTKQPSKDWRGIWLYHPYCQSLPWKKCYIFTLPSQSQLWAESWFVKTKASRTVLR